MSELPVTVVVSRRPAPAREIELEEWARGLVDLASRFPGHLDGDVMPTTDGGGDLVVALSFVNADAAHDWEHSPERDSWLARADGLVDGPARPQSLGGFESIFASSTSSAVVPRWKTAVVIVLAIYPASLLLQLVLGPVTASWPLPLRALVSTLVLVPFMVWVGVPWLSRWLDTWLHRRPDRG
jgi:antibiotic biosynthesis monooxygenase (ABM) superfamily enzyme